MIGLCIDVTEAKSLAAVAARADAASRAKSSFLATMSHELRTPLNSVIGFSTLMLDGLAGPVNDEQRTQLAIIQRSGQQLLELVSEFLDLAKVEAGQLAVANAPVDLGALVREQCDLMRLQATQRGLELEQPASASPIVVFADSKRLRQVIHNLVSNAIKFTDLGGIRIDVAVVDGHRARVSVHDTGIGIAPLDQSKLFVPFARVRALGAPERPGTGLGLAISRRLVEAMNGDIGVTSEPGRGSTFWFTVPLDADSRIAAPDCDADPAFACLAATADITLDSATKD
jgi:signal transduction histidine kinase